LKWRKVLNDIEKSKIDVKSIFTDSEIKDRHKDYLSLSDKAFDTKYRDKAFEPVELNDDGKTEKIQFNYYSDPFCPNYDMPLKTIKPRGTRSVKNYTYVNAKDETRIMCNVMEYIGAKSRVDNNSTPLISNWSVAEEIKRLKIINSIIDEEVEYVFHNPTCINTTTPFDVENSFIKYGKTKSGSILVL